MKYAPLIQRALSTAGRDISLSDLLAHVDALNKSVPTLEELNRGLEELGKEPVTLEAYRKAVAENRERVVQHLANSGMPPERQQEILQRYAALMGKHDT